MFKGDAKDYFGGLGGGPMSAEKKPVGTEKGDDGKDGDGGVTTHTHKKENGKFHSSIDKHDGYPPDEMDHDGIDDAKEAHGQALTEKYGDERGEQAAESTGEMGHKKVGNYMAKMTKQSEEY